MKPRATSSNGLLLRPYTAAASSYWPLANRWSPEAMATASRCAALWAWRSAASKFCMSSMIFQTSRSSSRTTISKISCDVKSQNVFFCRSTERPTAFWPGSRTTWSKTAAPVSRLAATTRLPTTMMMCHWVSAMASIWSADALRLPLLLPSAAVSCDLGMSFDSAKIFLPSSGAAGLTRSVPWNTPCDDSQAKARSGAGSS
ncbi:hypothetical protein VTK73DRAFT_3878 [Phialemonium thermophilum]|uniref:Uncharacterized protein n=1 Tax=Phialemonium thermophilum TaxID=223376 RepID=A0ABR3VDI3_9PEZI